MSAKNTLEKIAGLLNIDLAVEESQTEVSLATMKLENGTILEAEKFETGEPVFIQTDDERVALPVGAYELEDGRQLTVAEEGVIASIQAMEEEEKEEASVEAEVEEEVEMAEEEEKEEMAYATKRELAEAVDEVKEMVKEIKAMVEKDKKEKKEEASSENLSKQEPAAKPIKANPENKEVSQLHTFSQGRKKTTLDRVLEKMANYK